MMIVSTTIMIILGIIVAIKSINSSPTKTTKIAGVLIIAAMIILGVADGVLVMTKGVEYSMSRFIQDTGFDHPVFTLMIGFLLGHFFGYMPRNKDK